MNAPHRPRKRFGQHFLHDPGTIARILAAIAPAAGDHLVEIGPGRGALTVGLLEAAGRLDVVELDRDLIPLLRERCAGHGTLTVHQADAMAFDFCTLGGGRPLRLVGNLPYNISSPLLFHLLGQAACIRDMHFMLQREVVERMAAPPGSRTYGRLSVMVQYHCRAEALFTVHPGAFHPPPKVDSAVVRLVPHARRPLDAAGESRLAALVRQAFTQRRKTLRNGLKGLLDEPAIRAAGLDPGARPETVSVEQFIRLAQATHPSNPTPVEPDP
jgi:16S rRNA (adenine1518-N6/adenine1519-N6)-dimethyltransferase